jgi:hypothetical protein
VWRPVGHQNKDGVFSSVKPLHAAQLWDLLASNRVVVGGQRRSELEKQCLLTTRVCLDCDLDLVWGQDWFRSNLNFKRVSSVSVLSVSSVVFHWKDESRSLSLESLVGDYLPYLYKCQLFRIFCYNITQKWLSNFTVPFVDSLNWHYHTTYKYRSAVRTVRMSSQTWYRMLALFHPVIGLVELRRHLIEAKKATLVDVI